MAPFRGAEKHEVGIGDHEAANRVLINDQRVTDAKVQKRDRLKSA